MKVENIRFFLQFNDKFLIQDIYVPIDYDQSAVAIMPQVICDNDRISVNQDFS